MKCPHCHNAENHVIDSRPVETASVIRRRRECLKCSRRFTTYERVESMPLIVIKSNNRREPFDREKLKEGLSLACNKRKVTSEQIEAVVEEVEAALQEEFVMEVPSKTIGELILNRLKKLDEVAYIRFASVYKQFSSIDAFLEELRGVKKEKLKGRIKEGLKTKLKPKLPSFLNVTLTKN
jgi:transcriptional repressor NrdR